MAINYYNNNKQTKIKFWSDHLGKQIDFDAFIKSLTINLNIKKKEQENSKSDSKLFTDKGLTVGYSFSLDIPSVNLTEAIDAANKIKELTKFFRASAKVRNKVQPIIVDVLFSNLISNGYLDNSWSPEIEGLSCNAESFNVDHNADFGFFEDSGKIYPKVYSISFTLKALPVQSNGYLCLGFKGKEKDPRDPSDWPFGVHESDTGTGVYWDTKHPYCNPIALTGFSYSNSGQTSYTQNKSAFIRFSKSNKTMSVDFAAFVTAFSRENSYTLKERKIGRIAKVFSPIGIKNAGFKFNLDIPSNSLDDAILNCAKVQHLVRLLVPPRISGVSGTKTHIFFNRQINGIYYVNSLSIKIDVDQGFFEPPVPSLQDQGWLFPKNMSIDFNVTKAYVLNENDDSFVTPAPTTTATIGGGGSAPAGGTPSAGGGGSTSGGGGIGAPPAM